MKSSRTSRSGKKPAPLTYQERAQLALQFWREVLRLQDWDITLEFKRKFDMHEQALGACRVRVQEMTAKIFLAEPDDIGEDWGSDSDLELTLVHELMHVKLQLLVETKSDLALEQVVEGLSKIFVRLVRTMEAGEEI